MESPLEQLLTMAGHVVVDATTGELEPDTALEFCRVLLPHLLTELEIARRVEASLSERFPDPAVPVLPSDCTATVCSNRWPKVEAAKTPLKARKKAARRKKNAS